MILLASSSPRRKDLLTQHNVKFHIHPHNFNESCVSFSSFSSSQAYCEALSEGKAKSITSPGWILSADTIVVYNNKVYPKPKDLEEASSFLNLFSGNQHHVISSFCLYNADLDYLVCSSDTVAIVFNTLSKAEIKQYVTQFKPLDKAGGYGLQELPIHFVKKLNGSRDTVIGLPIELVLSELRKVNLI